MSVDLHPDAGNSLRRDEPLYTLLERRPKAGG
jgi:hypothetical protein